jgi:hypothetical protein
MVAEKINAFMKITRFGTNLIATTETLLAPEITRLQSGLILAQANQLTVLIKRTVGNPVFHSSSSG